MTHSYGGTEAVTEAVAAAIGEAARNRHGSTMMEWALSPEREDCLAFAQAAIKAYAAATLRPFKVVAMRLERDYPDYPDEASVFFDLTHGDFRKLLPPSPHKD